MQHQHLKPNRHHQIRLHFVVVPLILAILALFACKTKPLRQQYNRIYQAEINNKPNDLALIEATDIFTKDPVHGIRLDQPEFRISAFRVGIQTFLQHDTPILSYEMPLDSDFVEIIRCKDDQLIFGGADYLHQVELGSKDLAEETKIFQRNDFWQAALSQSDCLLLTTSYTDLSFEDTFATTGSYRYYIRACIEPDRLSGAREFSSKNCSRFVSQSTAVEHVNKRSEEELAVLKASSDLTSQIHSLNRSIIYKTMLLNKQLFQCQERNQKKVLTYNKKNAIANILGVSVAVGIPAISFVALKSKQALSPSYNQSFNSLERQIKKTANVVSEPTDSVPNIAKKQLETLSKELNQHEINIDKKIRSWQEIGGVRELNESENGIIKSLQDQKSQIAAFKKNTTDTTSKEALDQLSKNLTDTYPYARNKLTKAADALSVGSMSKGAAVGVASSYAAGSQAIPGYPKDAKYCYNSESLLKTVQGGATQSEPDQEGILVKCSCALALGTQTEITVLAKKLESLQRRTQAQTDEYLELQKQKEVADE